MTGERYYDYYGRGAAYSVGYGVQRPRASYMDMAHMQTGHGAGRRMDGSYAPRRPGSAKPRTQASRASAAGRPHPAGSQRPAPRNAAAQGRRAPANVRRGTVQTRRPASVRGRRRGGLPVAARLGAAVVAGIIVLGLLIFGGVRLASGLRTATVEQFVNNVYVNGVCLTGYTREEGYQMMYDLRDQWLGTTYPLTFQGRTWDFTPATVNAALELDQSLEKAWNLGHVGDRRTRREIIQGLEQMPAEFESKPTYDEAALDEYIARIAEDVYTAPVDAEVTLTEVKPMITRASQNGWELDSEALKATLIGLIETGKGDLNLPVNELQPAVVSDNMEMSMISEFQTDITFRGVDSRSNVRTALNHFNLFTVNPGDTVSFNNVVGPRTEALGFREAPEYAGSKEEMGIGGGVCQASTTLYNAMIQAGMTIIERHNHTMTVSYVEPSQDAAVNYEKKDFVFRNDTGHAIYIYTDVNKERAKVTVYGTRPEYKYVLESVIKEEKKSNLVGYQDDLSGKHVYYTTDTPVLYKEGHGSCHSEGWLVSYDWNTQQEVERVKISYDMYNPGINVYWKGIHNPDGTLTTATEEPSQF